MLWLKESGLKGPINGVVEWGIIHLRTRFWDSQPFWKRLTGKRSFLLQPASCTPKGQLTIRFKLNRKAAFNWRRLGEYREDHRGRRAGYAIERGNLGEPLVHMNIWSAPEIFRSLPIIAKVMGFHSSFDVRPLTDIQVLAFRGNVLRIPPRRSI